MQENTAAIIVAASSTNRSEEYEILWTPLAGRITLARTIDVFETSRCIHSIVLVLDAAHLAKITKLSQHEGWQKVTALVADGSQRQDAVHRGLDALTTVTPEIDWVIIHDAARPLVTQALLEAGLQAAKEHLAASAAVPVKETIKQVHQGLVSATLDRSQLWTIQTPQVFSYSLIHQAYHSLTTNEAFSDDAALLASQGKQVFIFPGSYTNVKITNQADLLLAEALLEGQVPL